MDKVAITASTQQPQQNNPRKAGFYSLGVATSGLSFHFFSFYYYFCFYVVCYFDFNCRESDFHFCFLFSRRNVSILFFIPFSQTILLLGCYFISFYCVVYCECYFMRDFCIYFWRWEGNATGTRLCFRFELGSFKFFCGLFFQNAFVECWNVYLVLWLLHLV